MTQCASFFAFKFQHCQALNCASSRGPLGPRHDVASFTVTDFSKKTHVVSRKIRCFQLVCNLLQLLETAKRAFSADQSKHGNKMKQSSAFGRNPCVSHNASRSQLWQRQRTKWPSWSPRFLSIFLCNFPGVLEMGMSELNL